MNNFSLKQLSVRVLLIYRGLCSSKMPPKIYTKTGDKGTTSTFTGERRSKDDLMFDALGTADELSCSIGIAREFALDAGHEFTGELQQIQCVIQDLASAIATPKSSASPTHLARTQFDPQHVKDLEKWIDTHTARLPPLRNFILPSGGKCSANLHMARSTCRSAERKLVRLVRSGEVDESTLQYLNRLSDYLFMVARYACHAEGREEMIYRRPKPS